MLRFSLRTRAFKGFRDWNICYERVFEYGETYRTLRERRPRRVLDVAGDLSIFGCFLAEELGASVDIVDMGSLDYCAALRSSLTSEVASRITLFPHRRAEELPDATYDAVYCISAIEHFDGDADVRFVERLPSLLVPGGVAVITAPFTPLPESVRRYRDVTYYDTHGASQSDPHFYMRYYSSSAIADLAARSGLQLERLTFAAEVVNFCEPIFCYGADGAHGPRARMRAISSRVIGAFSPVYPFLFMRKDSDVTSFASRPQRTTSCNPDTFFLVLRKQLDQTPVAAA